MLVSKAKVPSMQDLYGNSQTTRAIATDGAPNMNSLIKLLTKSPLVTPDLDYYLIRGSMVVIFVLFGYQKWFEYEAQVPIPYISHGPLTFWLYPAFGIRGGSWFLGVMEWLVAVLLFMGFRNRKLGMLGALGSVITFFSTVTIIPFMPNAWEASVGGFPAMAAGTTAFLMKDVVLLAASVYLLKEDALSVFRATTSNYPTKILVRILTRSGLLASDFDYHLLRASMVIVFFFFGFTKWFQYGAEAMVPFISHGPFIFWLYPAFGFRGAARFLGTSEWLTCLLLFSGFWNKNLAILGAIASTVTFVSTITIIPFIPGGWAVSARGFPVMAGPVPFLMKDVVLLAVSVYSLKQDVVRATASANAHEAMPRPIRPT
jgi:uncharacterized membrane protein YkgB